ncbi:alpha/beta fold hydrolase [Peribacillus sp. SCS-37]|uniref:alpha/beta fold hydrolase n=1 Tax=Paraperibacillus esterisolvens TaxID=3115296 RepID=UPI003905FBEE
MIQGWVRNGDIKIHYMDNSGREESYTPLVIIPGLTESAEDYEDVLLRLQPRRAVVISLRGRGRSDAPETGYSLDDHIRDVESVIDQITLDEFAMFGFSRGVSYTLAYALKHKEKVKGLILGDYPAVHESIQEGWSDMIAALPEWRGKPILQRLSLDTLRRIEEESGETSPMGNLEDFTCPVLIIRGGREGALLSDEDVESYLNEVPNARFMELDTSGGNLFPDNEEFARTIQEFFEEAGSCGDDSGKREEIGS